MAKEPAFPEITARIKQVGRNANKLLMIEYFMRQYTTLSGGLSKLVERYDADCNLPRSSKRSKRGPLGQDEPGEHDRVRPQSDSSSGASFRSCGPLAHKAVYGQVAPPILSLQSGV